MTKKWFVPFLLIAGLCGCADGNEGGSTADCSAPGYVKCGDSCINPASSRDYCGADTQCKNFDVCDTTEVCKQGECVVKNGGCTGETPVVCSGTCVNPQTDKEYCGADSECKGATPCGPNEVCSGGKCKSAKCEDKGLMTCDGLCVDPKTDNNYCGAQPGCTGYVPCNTRCINGICQPVQCNDFAGELSCNGQCINPLTDDAHCGKAADGCAALRPCQTYQKCSNGVCRGMDEANCTGTEIFCDGMCVDPQTDTSYCGATNCSNGTQCQAQQICDQGTCKKDPRDNCVSPEFFCDGTCINPKENKKYCGATDCENGTRCRNNEACIEGECKPDIQCNEDIGEIVYCEAAGKCIDPYTDPNYCGAGFFCEPDSYEKCDTANSMKCVGGKCTFVPQCLVFKDSVMEEFALTYWDLNGNDCIDTEDIQKIDDAKFKESIAAFRKVKDFTSIDDLNYFTKITELPNTAFKGCEKLKSVNLTNITKIGTNVFEGCTELTDVTLPRIQTLTKNAFKGCTKLKNASFDTVKKFNTAPFEGCTKLSKLSLPTPEPISIGSGIFGGDAANEKEYTEDVTLTLNKNKKDDVEVKGIIGFRTFLWNNYYWYGVKYVE